MKSFSESILESSRRKIRNTPTCKEDKRLLDEIKALSYILEDEGFCLQYRNINKGAKDGTPKTWEIFIGDKRSDIRAIDIMNIQGIGKGEKIKVDQLEFYDEFYDRLEDIGNQQGYIIKNASINNPGGSVSKDYRKIIFTPTKSLRELYI